MAVKFFDKRQLLLFVSLLVTYSLGASCRDSLNPSTKFIEIAKLCDIRSYVLKFKQMSEEELMFEKNVLDVNESQELFRGDELHLVKRWLVETRLQTNRAESSKEVLVDYYFGLFHKLSDPHKFHVDHPLVIQSRLVRSYANL